MDMVRIRATISAHGLVKGQEVTVAETPVIAGGIGTVFELLERIPADNDEQVNAEAVSDPPEATPPVIEDLELPDPISTDDGETPATEYQLPGKKPRG